MAKSSKSHPTDSDVGVRTSESGVGRLRGFASKPPPPLSLSALRPLFRHRNQVGNRLAGKNKAHVAGTYLLCRHRRHHKSALSFDAEKEGASCGASATGWRIGQILRAPCSAAARTLPRRTTCGGFWYFWPQKYKGKVHETCRFSKIHTSEQKSNSRGRKRAVARAGSGTKKSGRLFQVVRCGSGGRTRTSDLRVMSPTSCQLLYPAMYR